MPVLGNGDTPEIARLFKGKRPVYFRRKETVIRAGDEPQDIYFISKGFVRVYTVLENGRDLTLTVYGPGSYFPLIMAFSDMESEYYYEALGEVGLFRIERKVLAEFVLQRPEVLLSLMKRTLLGLSGLLNNLELMFSGSAENRVAGTIFLLAKRFGVKSKMGIVVKMPITHQEIASLSAITRETASVVLKKMERDGLIAIRGKKLYVLDLAEIKKKLSLPAGEEKKPMAVV